MTKNLAAESDRNVTLHLQFTVHGFKATHLHTPSYYHIVVNTPLILTQPWTHSHSKQKQPKSSEPINNFIGSFTKPQRENVQFRQIVYVEMFKWK